MVLWGTIVNVIAIIIGSISGVVLPRMSEGIRNVVMQGLGLGIVILGISMGLRGENFLFVIISLVAGGVTGELLKLDLKLKRLGQCLEKAVRKGNGTQDEKASIAEGFITATLVYCIGAMAILGAIDSGLRQDHTILYTKSLLDGVSAILFTSTLGIGVIFSAVSVLLYQGAIALSATLLTSFLSSPDLNAIIAEVTAVGGVLIAGIGINILEIRKINVVNLLPSVAVVALVVFLNLRLGWF
ncbi:MAG: DUF554 domain-containing protein [Chitinispirillaceae bacterium]